MKNSFREYVLLLILVITISRANSQCLSLTTHDIGENSGKITFYIDLEKDYITDFYLIYNFNEEPGTDSFYNWYIEPALVALEVAGGLLAYDDCLLADFEPLGSFSDLLYVYDNNPVAGHWEEEIPGKLVVKKGGVVHFIELTIKKGLGFDFASFDGIINSECGEVCQEVLNIYGAVPPVFTYHANDLVNSNTVIKDGYEIFFKAPNEVNLENEFEVELGAVFTVEIESCSVSPFQRNKLNINK